MTLFDAFRPAARGAALRFAVTLAAVALATTAEAAPTSPTAAMASGDSFVNFTGTGPIGNGEVRVDNALFWFYEGSGVYQGQAVDSWYLFFDPATDKNAVQATVTFASAIASVFTDVNSLITTANFCNPNVMYNYTTTHAGLELNDVATASGHDLALQLQERISNPGDNLRVLTLAAPVPEPATWALMAAGLAAVGATARRRRA